LVYNGPPNKALDGGWPNGWVQKTFQRHGSYHFDSYYFDPTTGQKFRSLTEVRRFLKR
jgi:Methyl-CpG binding domain